MNRSGKIDLTAMLIFILMTVRVFAQQGPSNQHVQYPTNSQKKYSGIAKEGDTKFLLDAIQSNTDEIKMTQLAEEKSRNTNVRSVAINLKTDHQRLLDELQEIADRKSIAIPLPDSIIMQSDTKELLECKPADFDEKWIDVMIKSHQETLEKLQKSQSTISDNDIRGWIRNTIPKVENHITQLTDLKKKVE